MIHFITESGSGNKELKNRRWVLPDGVLHHLQKVKEKNKKDELTKNHTTKEAWDHLIYILDHSNGINYQEMKRIKNWFDKNTNATKTKQYELYGGEIMKTWVNNQLNSAVLIVKKHKEAQRAMGKENAFIKPHEADRQTTATKPDTKVPTYNPATLNKQNRLKELSAIKESKTIILTEQQSKLLKEMLHADTKSDIFDRISTLCDYSYYDKAFQLCSMYFGKPIDVGSSRVVYQIDDEKVLKLALNDKGKQQNEVEISAYQKTTKFKELFPIIYSYDKDGNFLITEYVLSMNLLVNTPNTLDDDSVDVDDIFNVLGVTEDQYDDILDYVEKCMYNGQVDYVALNNTEFGNSRMSVYQFIDEKMQQNRNFDLLMQYLFNNPDLAGESFRRPNIGIARRNGESWVVILDNGWDGNTAKMYNQPNFGTLNV